MLNRIARRSKFAIERLLVRGAQYRLMLVACLIGLLSVVGGALVILGSPEFDDFGEAVWWAFLRLSDPGYLGDDTGTLRRIVSTFLTVAGYVVFLGALVAIMTQWLNATMRRLESGLTPVARRGHLLVLGWTNRTPTIIQELLLSEGRVRRFLQRYGTRGLHIVVLAAEVTAERLEELRGRVGPGWDGSKITLRSGSPLVVDDLERVDFPNASGILIPGSDSSADRSASYDTRTIKTLLSLSRHPQSAGRQRRELRPIFDGLFAAGGADVFFRSASSYCLTGDDVDFARVQEAAMERGETALGVRLRDGHSGPRLRLNPGRDER